MEMRPLGNVINIFGRKKDENTNTISNPIQNGSLPTNFLKRSILTATSTSSSMTDSLLAQEVPSSVPSYVPPDSSHRRMLEGAEESKSDLTNMGNSTGYLSLATLRTGVGKDVRNPHTVTNFISTNNTSGNNHNNNNKIAKNVNESNIHMNDRNSPVNKIISSNNNEVVTSMDTFVTNGKYSYGSPQLSNGQQRSNPLNLVESSSSSMNKVPKNDIIINSELNNSKDNGNELVKFEMELLLQDLTNANIINESSEDINEVIL